MAVSKDKGFGDRWIVSFRYRHVDGRVERVRRVSPVQTKRGAEQYERELRQALLDGTYRREAAAATPTEVPTLAAFAKQWLTDYVEVHNKPSELESKQTILRVHLVPAFGERRLDGITAREVDRFIARQLKSGLSRKTVNNQLTVLRRMLRQAVEWRVIPPSAVPVVVHLKTDEPDFDFFDFDEVGRLEDAAWKHEKAWAPMIVAALRSGLRMGELLALRWEDVDLVSSRIFVRQSTSRGAITTPKSGKPREVPVPPSLVAVLKSWRHLRSKYVFPREDGSIGSKAWAKRPLWRVCERAGLRLVGWHVLRHTYASHLAMDGVSIKVIQELLGHTDIKTTMRYAHLSPAAKSEAVKVLDRPRRRSSEPQTAAAGGQKLASGRRARSKDAETTREK